MKRTEEKKTEEIKRKQNKTAKTGKKQKIAEQNRRN